LDAAHQARADKDYSTAIHLYRQAGDSTDALFWLATVQRWSGDLNGAENSFARLLSINPQHGDALLGDAHLALMRHDPDRAEINLKRLLALKPADAEARRLLLTTYQRQHRPRDAYRLAESGFDGDERLRLMADTALELMWYRRAASSYRQLVDRHPADIRPLLGLGHSYERMGYLGDALVLYHDALKTFPNHAALQRRVARTYRGLGRYASSADYFERVLANRGDDVDALLGRARVEMDRDNLSRPGAPNPRIVAVASSAKTVPAAKAPVPIPIVVEPAPEAPEPQRIPVAVIGHQVASGDTLGRIAQHYYSDSALWQVVANANRQLADPNRIGVGEWLKVPIWPVLEAGANVVLLAHTLVAGETYPQLAQQYMGEAALWPLILKVNASIEDVDAVVPGTEVSIPVVLHSPRPVVLKSADKPLIKNEKMAVSQSVHRVAPGDTLGTIAKQHLGSASRWRELLRANPQLTDPNYILVGQLLAIPALKEEAVAKADVAVVATPQPKTVAPQVTVSVAPPVTLHEPRQEPKTVSWLSDIRGERFGAAEWLDALFLLEAEHRGGREVLGRLQQRRLAFPEAEEIFKDLHLERPEVCRYCNGWIDAREARRPVLEFGFRHSVSDDLDGRSDRTTTPLAVRYRTRGWHLEGRDRVVPRLTLSVRQEVTDTSLTERVSGQSIYDFKTRTSWLNAIGHLAHRHTVTAGVGLSDYSPNDGSSIADRQFSRYRLRWDRTTHRNEGHVALQSGPFLGRGINQGAFGLFRETQLSAAGGMALNPALWLYGRAVQRQYSDDHSLLDLSAGLKVRLDTHRLNIRLSQGHHLGRFLDEATPDLRLVFVTTRELTVEDRWRRPFPFRFMTSAWLRQYEANSFTLLSSGVRQSPANQEVGLKGEAAYVHPALRPLSFGLTADWERFRHDAEAYNTLNQRGIGLFVQVADKQPRCWDYLLRYGLGVRWDEDPANGHYFAHALTARLGRAVGRHANMGVEARWRAASAFDERGTRVVGNLLWRF
jgi:nucleoid-associated protein YgaU